MSEENIQLARDVQARWNRGDLTVDPETFHPEVEFVPLRAATEGVYRGHDGIERFLADTSEVFEKFEWNYEYADLGERVLAWGTIHLRARGSGVETDVETGGLVDFRDGKIVRWEDFGSKDRALEAAEVAE